MMITDYQVQGHTIRLISYSQHRGKIPWKTISSSIAPADQKRLLCPASLRIPQETGLKGFVPSRYRSLMAQNIFFSVQMCIRDRMRTEIAKLHQRLGTTFIYVTHDQTEAMTMGDRIVVMKDGFIQQVDTPQNLYEKPCNEFVAGDVYKRQPFR